jgi:hypothetical protein
MFGLAPLQIVVEEMAEGTGIGFTLIIIDELAVPETASVTNKV